MMQVLSTNDLRMREVMKKNRISRWLFAQVMVVLLLWPAAAFCSAGEDRVLEAARQKVAAELNRLDEGLREAAAALGKPV